VVDAHGVDDVVRAVKDAAARGSTLRVAGAGHSFTPLVATEGTLLRLRFAGIAAVDPAAGQATVWAGTHLRDLTPALDAHGLGMENLGDIDAQALAGALATGTHGTGLTLPNLSAQVEGLTVVDGRGEVVECSADDLPAARVSLGALGVVVAARLRLLPAYRLREVKARMSLDACLERITQLRDAHRHFELFWFPHTDTAITKALDPTAEPGEAPGPLARLMDLVVENGAFGLLSRACRIAPALSAPVSRICAAAAGTGTRVGRSFRIFATPRLVRFREMEYALPAAAGPAALRELARVVAARGFQVHFPVEFRFGAGDDAWLSPASLRPTAYVAVHMYQGMAWREYFDAAEAIFRAHGGRPHWGKWHSLTARDLAPLYPRWDDFAGVRARWDPAGVFGSPYLNGLLGEPLLPR
jgi:L-gulonolactone oxidase